MDIKALDAFFNYEPFIGQDPQIIVDGIIKQAEKYLPAQQIPLIQEAYEFARKAHGDQLRLSKEAYIVHPLKATEFLMEIRPDIATIQTCILHDVIEDTTYTQKDIEKTFGKEVADLCEGMVKVSKIKYKWEDRHLETLKKTFLAMAKDLRVIFVKLADRIHNIQTLYFHPNPVKRQKIAQETMKIFVAIAKRLGLYHYQLYLENGSFKILNEDAFNNIFSYLKKYFGEGDKYTVKGTKILTNLLVKEGIENFAVKGRTKSPYRVYEKLEHKYEGKEIGDIMDLIAFRVITKDIGDCYMVLGIIHKHYTPVIKKIKDYIAVPKINGYKSIHTTILWMFPFPTEIQIRTQEMDDIAEFGVAAHFAYSEAHQPILVPEAQSLWIKKLQDLVTTYQSSDQREKFKSELNIEVLDKRIFVYTPKGDVLELPVGSTVLDFAFHIHTEIGLRFKSAIVNGEIKPISFKPETGDVVGINTFKNRYSANKHRLDFLYTPVAKGHLNKFIKAETKSELFKQAIIELNRILKEYGLPAYDSGTDKITKTFNKQEIEKKLLEIIDKKRTYNQLIKAAYPSEREKLRQNLQKTPLRTRNAAKTVTAGIILDEDKVMNYTLCNECKPTSDKKIIAKTGKDGIKIHTLECKSLKTISFEKLMEAHRADQEKTNYKISIEIKILNKYGNLLKVMTTFSELRIVILQIFIKNIGDGTSIIMLESEFSNPSRIWFLLNSLKKYDTSVQVIKKKIS